MRSRSEEVLMKRFRLLLLVVAMGAAAMAPAGAAPPAGGAVIYPILADPTFNPWHPRAFVESVFPNRVIFPGLTRPGRDLRPAPDLAERWELSRDGLTWTFFLRRGVKWHDGRDFTAEDVKFTFDLVLNPRLGAQNRGVYSALREVQVVNPTTVRFLLRAPQASLATVLGINSGIIPKHAFDGVADPWTLDAFNKRAPIGTGPYRVQTYVPGSSVTLTRNDAYFGGRPNLDSVTFKVLPDPNTQVAQLLSGELTLAIVDNPALVAGLQGRPEIEITQIPQVQFYWLAVNHANPILNDKRLKQAMMHAVDRPAMVRGFLQGYARPATGMISPALSYYYRANVKDYPFDREQARKLLSEAGWRPGPDRVLVKDGRRASFTMAFPTVQMFPGLAALVQQYFRE
ncbi:MAG: ABC transporter substrate-binding protein, partial [Armatimonadetes bacterium]|nr:ABC transporter substrate-binding protein [Armatimonadota bacterium]